MLREDAPGVEKEVKESRADSRQEVKLNLRLGHVVVQNRICLTNREAWTVLYSTANDP